MRNLNFLIVCGLLISLLNQGHVMGQNQMEILQHWAPEVYQDMNSSKSGWWSGNRQYYTARDAIVKVDFDGDFYTGNNWDHSHYQTWEQGQLSDRLTPPLVGASYFSFVETQNFYFLGYGFYHAGDDSNISQDRHENDWEMVMMCIKKNGTTYGEFKAMLTQFHSSHKEYVSSDLQWNGSHPKIYISANGTFDLFSPEKHGHGIERFTNSGYQDDQGNDAVVYQVADYGGNVLAIDIPGTDNWDNARRYKYKLISINELWNRRNNSSTYKSYTTFQGGVSGVNDGGNPPWDRSYFHGPIDDFKNRDKFNFLDSDLNGDSYIYNPYYGNNSGQNDNYNPNEIMTWPSGWSGTAIGSGSGKVYHAKSTFTIDGKGSDIWNTSDNFYYLYKDLSGDGEISARVQGVQNIHEWSKAGVMIRESTNSNSKYAYMMIRPDMNLSFQYRISTGANAMSETPGYNPSNNKPVYLKIKRTGDMFEVFYSTDGSNYTFSGSETITMANDVKIGLAVTSHDAGQISSAVIDNVSISGSLRSAAVGKGIANRSDFESNINVYSHNSVVVISSDQGSELVNSLVKVYDLNSRLVKEERLTQTRNYIEMGGSPSGVYMVQVILPEKTIVKKIAIR